MIYFPHQLSGDNRSFNWALPEWPMQGSKGVIYVPFSCRGTYSHFGPFLRAQLKDQTSDFWKGTKIWEQKLREVFTDALQVRVVQEIPKGKKETIIIPLVKGKPGEMENVCRERLKTILENQVRETFKTSTLVVWLMAQMPIGIKVYKDLTTRIDGEAMEVDAETFWIIFPKFCLLHEKKIRTVNVFQKCVQRTFDRLCKDHYKRWARLTVSESVLKCKEK